MLSWRNISSPSSPRFCISSIALTRRAASSSRVKWSAILSIPSEPLICGCREARDSPLRGERNDRKLAPIVCLAAQGHPAIAEEPIRLGAGVAAHVLDDAQAESLQPADDIAWQIEHEAAVRMLGTKYRRFSASCARNDAGNSGPT